MIRWKVVSIFGEGGLGNVSCCVTERKYVIEYKKGETVKAKRGTLGIFTFNTEINANCFWKNILFWREYKIIKVKSIGRGRKPKSIGFADSLSSFYGNKNSRYFSITTPEGTICYSAVKVLE